MRILHVGPKNFPPSHGGVEKIVYDIVQGMPEGDSDVFVQWPTNAPQSNVKTLPKGLLASWRAVRSHVRDHAIDIVHLHKETFIPLALLLRLGGTRCVLTVHGCAWRLKRWSWRIRAVLWLLDCLACLLLPAVVFVGKRDHEAFARAGGRRAHWVGNGVQAGKMRRRLAGKGAVYVGRISPEKNVLAMAMAAHEARQPLDIYGPIDQQDPAYGQRLQAAIAGSQYVRYRGSLPAAAVGETLARYGTFINPSFSEGMPVAVLEAGAQSLHLVLSDIQAHRDLDFPSCQYIDPHNIDLAGVNQPDRPAGANRRHVLAKFGIDRMLARYQDIYTSLTTRPDTTQELNAKGSFWTRLRSTLFLLPAWFAPHKTLRVFFHRLRGVDIGRRVEIGYHCIIGNVHPGMIHIADHAVVAAHCILLEHDNSRYYTLGQDVRVGDIHIEEGAFVGVMSVILPGVTVGSRAIVGAMSLVNHDVPGHCVAAGVPVKVLSFTAVSAPRRDVA